MLIILINKVSLQHFKAAAYAPVLSEFHQLKNEYVKIGIQNNIVTVIGNKFITLKPLNICKISRC